MKTFSKLKNFLPLSMVAFSALQSLAMPIPIDMARSVKTFVSPNSQTEQCVAIAKLPIAAYDQDDVAEETRLCNLDFYNNTVALCPKIWSTSPGTIINSFVGLASSSEQAENTLCKSGSPLKGEAKFKQTMNQSDTSGTFSAASILYYHFSRALDTTVKVPVAVYRSMDKDAHYERVTSKAHPPASARMNVAGWNWIANAEQNPSVYRPTLDLFTKDLRQIYGTLLDNDGERYGVEINGTRKSGWGKGQNFDFQKTPAFLALKTPGTLEEAITNGYANAIQDPLMKSAFSSGVPSKQQMVLWMNEVSEIAILDYIFSQQDRVGNVDFQWFWSYVDETGHIKSDRVKTDNLESLSRANMKKIPVPAELAGKNPVLVQKTLLGDNDAGGLIQYANFAKSTGMLDGVAGMSAPIAHLNKGTYKRLLQLAADFKVKGPNYQILNTEVRPLGYNDAKDSRFNQLIGNTILAANLLEKNCKAGILKLDLVSFKKAMKNDFIAEAADCSAQN